MHKLDRLRHIREQRALTQDELAKLVGVSRQTIVRLEGGKPAMAQNVRKLAAALQVPIGDLIAEAEAAS